MAGILINITTRRLSEEDFYEVMDELLSYVIQISPVDTGFFASQWELDVQYPDATLYNDTAYGEYLDEGWSKQAPDGLTKPVIKYLRELVNGYS